MGCSRSSYKGKVYSNIILPQEIRTILNRQPSFTPNTNLWDAAEAVLRGMFIAIQSYLKKQEKHRINNLTFQLKQLENEKEKKTQN